MAEERHTRRNVKGDGSRRTTLQTGGQHSPEGPEIASRERPGVTWKREKCSRRPGPAAVETLAEDRP